MTATTIQQTANCSPVAGTTINATLSIPAIFCNGLQGTADDDVWFKFVATTANPTIVVTPSATLDVVVDLRSGNCNGSNIGCADYWGAGITETVNAYSLIIGGTYYVRVYSFGSGSSSEGAFSICVFGISPYPPVNDDCPAAIPVQTPPFTATTVSATQSTGPVSCDGHTGTPDDDVWFSFIPDSPEYSVVVQPTAMFDAVIDLRSGGCMGSTIACADVMGDGGVEMIKAIGLIPQDKYYIRIYSYGTGPAAEGEFNLEVNPNSNKNCPDFDYSIAPSTDWQIHTSTTGHFGNTIYQVYVSKENEYTFKTGCGNGATADYHTKLELFDDNCSLMAAGINSCELNRSILTWVASFTGYAFLKISGEDSASFGNYTLAYKSPYPVSVPQDNEMVKSCDGLVIYPNPTNGSFSIEKKEKIRIESVRIYDLTGRLLLDSTIERDQPVYDFKLINLESGSYVITVNLQAKWVFLKLQVIR
ncbi:MAG: T9SS type A sorting domain-containing protein [Bacteroidota bacterium]